MVGKFSREELKSNSRKALESDQAQLLLEWISRLQKAFTLEVEKGFNDLQGRQEFFHQFAQRQLSAFDEMPLPKEQKVVLKDLSEQFLSYPDKSESVRRRLISKSHFSLAFLFWR